MQPILAAATICFVGCALHFLASLKPDPVPTFVELGRAFILAGAFAVAFALLLTAGGDAP